MAEDKMIEKWQKTKKYKKLHKFSTVVMIFLKIVIFLCLIYSSAVMYTFGYEKTAGIIFIALSGYIIFNWLEAVSR